MRNIWAWIFVAIGCHRADVPAGRYELVVDNVSPGTPISIARKSAAVLDVNGTAEVELPKDVYLANNADLIAAQVTTPCGVIDVALAPKGIYLEQDARSKGERIRALLELPQSMRFVTVWVDRAHSGKVAIGSLVLDRALEVHGRIRVVWPDCEAGRSITIDGREIGKLPAEPPANKELVIAAAPTCYRLREIAYARPTSYGRGADDVVFDRTQMAWVGPLLYFLEDAPQTIASNDISEMRLELKSEECARRRIGSRDR